MAPAAMCKNVEHFRAERRGDEVVTDFARLYREHKLREHGKPARDMAARRSLDYLSPENYAAMVNHGESEEARRRQVDRDIRVHGQRAVGWYAATAPQYLPQRAGTPRRGHVGPRAARPRSRAVARASSRGGDSGDPDLADEPPGHRPPLLERAAA